MGKESDGGAIRLKYGFPRNFFIVGTMNSADQGVFPLDTAFKRRWHFRHVPTDFEKHKADANFHEPRIRIGELEISWLDFATTINTLLEENQITEDRVFRAVFPIPYRIEIGLFIRRCGPEGSPIPWEDVLKLDDERSVIFNTIDYKTFTALQSSFLARRDVFNVEVRQRLAVTRDDAEPAES